MTSRSKPDHDPKPEDPDWPEAWGSVKPALTVAKARRLYDEAPSMTVKELYATGLKYGHAWLTGIRKPKLVRLFRKQMDRFLTENGATR